MTPRLDKCGKEGTDYGFLKIFIEFKDDVTHNEIVGIGNNKSTEDIQTELRMHDAPIFF